LSSHHSPFRKYRSGPLGYLHSKCKIAEPRRCSHLSAVESLEPKIVLAATVAADYAVTQNWGSGFEGQIKLTNQQMTAVNNWTLEFDFGATISSIWDGRIASHTGTHYVIANAGWNSTLAVGGQISFGFIAAPGSSPASPVNYLLNGKSISGGNPTPPPPTLPSITINDVTISEGNSGAKNATFTVTLSSAATSNITVNYATRNGTAVAGAAASGGDYTATSGKLTFAAGQISKTVNVGILGDTVFESDENFFLDLSAAMGATLARTSATGTITNDDAQPPPSNTGSPATISFTNTNDWGSGFNGDVAIRNTGTGAVRGWKLQFTFSGQISSIWNATIVSHTGSTYIVQGASWNSDIAAGQTIDFGFSASPGGTAAVLSSFALSGTVDSGGSTGGTSGTTNQPLASSQIAWSTHYYAPMSIPPCGRCMTL
jgi:hypothetical protein